MEEYRRLRRKKNLQLVSKVISYTFLSLLVFIGLFLITYVVYNKMETRKGNNPPLGLYTIISPSMTPNINVYDVVFTMKADINDLKKGDIITFYSVNPFFGGTPITHRIIEVLNNDDETKFVVKGDANQKEDEERVLSKNVLGKVLFKIPQLGRIQFFLASKGGWIIGIMIPALAVISYDIFKILRLILLKSKLLDLENKNGNI